MRYWFVLTSRSLLVVVERNTTLNTSFSSCVFKKNSRPTLLSSSGTHSHFHHLSLSYPLQLVYKDRPNSLSLASVPSRFPQLPVINSQSTHNPRTQPILSLILIQLITANWYLSVSKSILFFPKTSICTDLLWTCIRS